LAGSQSARENSLGRVRIFENLLVRKLCAQAWTKNSVLNHKLQDRGGQTKAQIQEEREKNSRYLGGGKEPDDQT